MVFAYAMMDHGMKIKESKEEKLRRLCRAWTQEEDEAILKLVERYGSKNWSLIGTHVKGRSGKQCRERYKNQLDPAIRTGPWTAEEDKAIVCAQRHFGNRWTEIAKLLPGRLKCIDFSANVANEIAISIGSEKDMATAFEALKKARDDNDSEDKLDESFAGSMTGSPTPSSGTATRRESVVSFGQSDSPLRALSPDSNVKKSRRGSLSCRSKERESLFSPPTPRRHFHHARVLQSLLGTSTDLGSKIGGNETVESAGGVKHKHGEPQSNIGRKRCERASSDAVVEPLRVRRRSLAAPPPLEMEDTVAPQREIRRSPRLAQQFAASNAACCGAKREDPRAGFEWSTPVLRSPGISPGKDWLRKYLGAESTLLPNHAKVCEVDDTNNEVGVEAACDIPFEGYCTSAAISLEEARHHFDCALEGTLHHLLPEASEAWVAGGGESQDACAEGEGNRCDSSTWDAAAGMPTSRGAGPTLPSPASLLLESLRVGGTNDCYASNASEGGVREGSPRLSPSIFWQSPSNGGRPLLLATPLNAFSDQSPLSTDFRRPIATLDNQPLLTRSNSYSLRPRGSDACKVRAEDEGLITRFGATPRCSTPRSGIMQTTPQTSRNSPASIGPPSRTRSADRTMLVPGTTAAVSSSRLNVIATGAGAVKAKNVGTLSDRRRARPPPIAAP